MLVCVNFNYSSWASGVIDAYICEIDIFYNKNGTTQNTLSMKISHHLHYEQNFAFY